MFIGYETEMLEFKKTTGELKASMFDICAMLNKNCNGTVYYGITDDGFAIGQNVSDSSIRDVVRYIGESIQPKIVPTVERVNIDGKNIIKVSVSGHNRPYSAYGDYVIRVGTENRKMTTDELRRLIKNEDYSSHWEAEGTIKTIDDIDDDTLKVFYYDSINCGRLSLSEYDKERLLSSIDVLHNGIINNAGFALFGKQAKISLKLATYATKEKITFLDLKIINGNIYTLIDKAISYVMERINWSITIGAQKRTEIPEIPERAIREIVVNSFAHANYESTPEIEINVHPDHIEIYNPGSFPDELTPYDFIQRNIPSYKRNRLILDILFRSKDVEKSGTGFQRVNALCQENGLKWDYNKEAYGFNFVFYRMNIPVNIPVETDIKLNATETQVYDLIYSNLKITKNEISKRIGKSEKTVQRAIAKLEKEKMIVRIGSNKSGYWEITNSTK